MDQTAQAGDEAQTRDRQLLSAVNEEMGVFVYAYIAGERPASEYLHAWTAYRAEIQQRYPSLVEYVDEAEAAIMRVQIDETPIIPMDMGNYVSTMGRIMSRDIQSLVEAALYQINVAQSGIGLTLNTLSDERVS